MANTVKPSAEAIQAARAALRLIAEGMGMKHAVSLAAGAIGIDTDLVYRAITTLDGGH